MTYVLVPTRDREAHVGDLRGQDGRACAQEVRMTAHSKRAPGNRLLALCGIDSAGR